MAHSYQEHVLALAGILQAASLVESIARKGMAPADALNASLNSILITNPAQTEDVYGDRLGVRSGLLLLKRVLERDASVMRGDALRYSLSLIQLEKLLRKQPDMLAAIGTRLKRVEEQVEHFDSTHETVIAALASTYQDTISTFKLRIHVTGDAQYLQNRSNADKVRAALFAGIRSAMLWRQVGGSRWQLMFGRKKMLECVNYLLQN